MIKINEKGEKLWKRVTKNNKDWKIILKNERNWRKKEIWK